MTQHSLTNLLVNMFFSLTDVCDILLSEIEYRIETFEQADMRQDIKQAFNMMKKAATDYHKKFDLYMDKTRIDSLPDKKNYDVSRSDANEFLRLLIAYADRCDTAEAATEIMNQIRALPSHVAPDSYIDKFTLK